MLITLSIALVSCNSGPSDKDMEDRAAKISMLLDNKSVSTFYEWNYYTRGGDTWVKQKGDTSLFTCTYFVNGDTTTLTVYRPENFINEFPCTFSFDTANYWRFSLKKYNCDIVNIEGVNNVGRDVSLARNKKLSSLFAGADPYSKISSLNKLKDELGVIAISSYTNSGIGNLIQFYLSRQHILTYFPDTLRIDNKYWKNELAKGKMLKKNWNFRKLDKPFDNG